MADAFGRALQRSVDVFVIPRETWAEAFHQLGFPREAAASYAGMTAISVDGGYDMPANPERGATSLTDYIERLVASAQGRSASI